MFSYLDLKLLFVCQTSARREPAYVHSQQQTGLCELQKQHICEEILQRFKSSSEGLLTTAWQLLRKKADGKAGAVLAEISET